MAEHPAQILAGPSPAQDEMLTAPAMEFVVGLQRRFDARRRELLERRVVRQQDIDAGRFPDFLPETLAVREGDWKVGPIPADLQDRRVEITGPVDRKMVINALNSDAKVFMADFEDSNSPTWQNNLQGQVNLRDAVAGTIEFTNPQGKHYSLKEQVATLFVRPRGWHLLEKHVLVDGQPVSGSLFDFGLFFFHNAHALIARGSGPYFYLPKLESHLEARLWNDVFVHAQEQLGIPQGTIRATVLIETITAAFEMDEILYELREHSAGLNCGRWDYIFSFIKRFRNHRQFVLPDRAKVGMDRHFLHSYVRLLIETCHRRGIHAMGGMAAQIPIKSDPEANETALAKVRTDKLREVQAGHDGTWVAHPGLVPPVLAIFDEHMPEPNQIDRQIPPCGIQASDLLTVAEGSITWNGLHTNLKVGIAYLAAWLGGNGCVPLNHLMEDAATAEISRAQVWQWLRHGAQLECAASIEAELVRNVLSHALGELRSEHGPEGFAAGRFEQASELFLRLIEDPEFPEFMTLAAYEQLLEESAR